MIGGIEGKEKEDIKDNNLNGKKIISYHFKKMEEGTVNLSLLLISGHIHVDTPFVVVKEIADAYNVMYQETDINDSNDYQRLINTIYRVVPPVISKTFQYEDYGKIVRYVNRNCRWPLDKLMVALKFLQQFTRPILYEHEFCYLLQNYPIGPLTPERPESVTACLLYHVCKIHRVETNRFMSFNRLVEIFELVHQSHNHIKQEIIDLIDLLPHDRLLYTYNMIRNEHAIANYEENSSSGSGSSMGERGEVETEETEETRYIKIVDTYHKFSDVHNLRKLIRPATKYEAIVLAAINFKYDISMAKNPIYEYYHLASTYPHYTPKDEVLMRYYRMDQYGIKLDVNFNPHLPQQLYDANTLRVLAINEGCTEEELNNEEPYELLQVISTTNNFYHGKLPNIVNTTTPISMEPIEEIDNDVILCYGIKGVSLVAIRYEELAGSFLSNINFKNPMDRLGETFEHRLIRKLKRLTEYVRCNDTEATINERKSLADAILQVEICMQESGRRTLDFRQVYVNADSATKQLIELALHQLTDLAMYMRGWRGSGSYPVDDAPLQNHYEIEVKVTEAMNEFDSTCQRLGPIGEQILNLPLCEYRNGKFSVSVSSNYGLTIGDRLDIIKNGYELEPFTSCIRITSNWLAASAYRYMEVLRLMVLFDITKLKKIS